VDGEFRLDVAKDTKEISVNVLDIDIHNVSLKSDSSTQSSKDITYDKENQRVTFIFEKSLNAGSKATLTIKYTGQLNNNMCGTKFIAFGALPFLPRLFC